MKQILGQLWNGNLIPVRTYTDHAPEIAEAGRALQNSGEALVRSLNDDQEREYERYAACLEEYLSLLTEQAFVEGFRCGAKAMTEVFSEN